LLKSVKNPYEKEKYSSKKIVEILKNSDVKNLKKSFFDIKGFK